MEAYGKWLPYITDLFLPVIDTENGDFRMLPFPGSAAEQPYMTMQVLRLIQLNYRKCLSERVQKMGLKAAAARRAGACGRRTRSRRR